MHCTSSISDRPDSPLPLKELGQNPTTGQAITQNALQVHLGAGELLFAERRAAGLQESCGFSL